MIDQQITQYLHRLNTRQKKALLCLVKAFAAQQKDWQDKMIREQKDTINRLSTATKKSKPRTNEKGRVLVLKSGATKKEIAALKKLYKGKTKIGFDAIKYNGVLKLKEAPLAIQKKMRDEWE